MYSRRTWKKLAKVLRKWKHANVDDEWENNTNAGRQRKGKAAGNYRPITCLSMVWKLLTGVFADITSRTKMMQEKI